LSPSPSAANSAASPGVNPAAAPAAKPERPSITKLHAAYRSGALTPSAHIADLLQRIRQIDCAEAWISRPLETHLLQEAAALDALLRAQGPAILDTYPLFGVPFAVKDNIDVKGYPTTAACAEFAYNPEQSAAAVQRLIEGHALFVGKTNLDQFATGLVGTRSPYGIVRNTFNPLYVSGGSSSGSAVVVAQGLASFALGTDTAGSGRVPAGLNGIVGLKPTKGLVSTRGVVPACRSLDCVSVFAADVIDAWRVLGAICGADEGDAYSRTPPMAAPLPKGAVIGLADPAEFFGDGIAAEAYQRVLLGLAAIAGCKLENRSIVPLLAAAELLYQGPWIAERRLVLGDFLEQQPQAIDPVVRTAIAAADRYSAADAFAAEYRMAGYRQAAQKLFSNIDALLVPTAPIHPTIAEVQADPVGPNARLGHYTNFVNLLDLAAIAVPATLRSDGLPFGITLIGPAGSDHRLAALAAKLSEHFGGEASGHALRIGLDPLPFNEPTIDVAVVGAHLAGQPLNWQLIECGARLSALTHTAPGYRLYALANTTPAKPGLVRVDAGGTSQEVEVWTMPERCFGGFIGKVGPPLGIGSLQLADGRWVKGFICEPLAVSGAIDISHHGGWRNYLAAGA
jgi:allophanate hydrolase